MYLRVTPQNFFSSLEKRKNGPTVTFAKLMSLMGLKTAAGFKTNAVNHVSAQGRNTVGFVVVIVLVLSWDSEDPRV